MSKASFRFREREDKWSRIWLKEGVFEADPDSNRPKFFLTFPFPYMNGSLHLGHAYTAGRLDVIARYMRLKGFNVLYPWAWHWTGEAVMGVVHRLEQNDKTLIERLIKLDSVEPSEINKFLDPVYLVKYFTKQGKEDIIRYGISIDWRREFHTTNLHPLYTKFVEWQIRSLYKKGLITQAPYPVVWCPRDKSPTGDHDRLKGEGVRPEEYTLIKFKLIDEKDIFLVAGTFRPETIFGATNIWVKKDVEYVLADVDDEKWIISKECAFKLSHQLRKVNVKKVIKGDELIGKYVDVPHIHRIIPVLPAEFVDPNLATGIVYSVPAHAPYDWLALQDLKKKVGEGFLLYKMVKDIKPISIIKVEGFGDYPALETVEKLKVSSQLDYKKADEATQLVYSKEFHEGVMKDNCLEFSGVAVKEAKEAVKETLKREGLLDMMYDLPEEVICRCGTRTIVKIIEDQWSLRYSDEEWKRLAKEAVDMMNIFPEEARKLFYYYIDWYHDWPCTRKTGLGTPFPFDKNWIVETLTDSTIYMAFYTIAKYYNMGLIPADKIDDDFYNYVFYGVGDVAKLKSKYNMSLDILKKIHEEFMYWYPLDLRGSGKDLIGNHLTFFIFQHVALFPKKHWPRAISVNGFTQLNGMPMSKSLGNYISLRKAMELYGADAVRVGILTLADGLEDPDVYLRELESISKKIESLPLFIKELFDRASDKKTSSFFDELIISQMFKILDEVDESLNKHRIGNAGKMIFYRVPKILRDYISYEKYPAKTIVKDVVEAWVKLISLYAPYIAEEIWHNILNKETFISKESWPILSSDLYKEKTLLVDEYAKTLLNDIENIFNILKITRETDNVIIKIVVPAPWKWKIMKKLIEKSSIPTVREIVDEGKKLHISPKEASAYGKMVLKQWFDRYTKHKPLLKIGGGEDELLFLKDIFIRYLKVHYPKAEYIILEENEAEKLGEKAFKSMPLIPSIFVEERG